MEVFQSQESIRQAIYKEKDNNHTIGFVPTMGALHNGHISLIECSIEQNDTTIVSIFVNPTQFNHRSDFEKYPRDLGKDLKRLEEAGVDMVFSPSEKEMYPEEDTREFYFGYLEEVMEGQHRPGHFNGVAQIVSKLFETIDPDKAYFGEKDFQQLVIIKKLVEKLDMDIEIVPCPIQREENGLAMSSRNERLNNEERENASLISSILFEARDKAVEKSPEEIKNWVVEKLNKNPFIDVEYFEIVDENTLKPVQQFDETFYKRACVAVWVGDVRLIDNVKFYF